MIDIADAAGVSYAVVSAVLNNSCGRSIRVSQETAMRVREIAERLNYHPNITAQMLAGGKSSIIGVLIDTQAISPNWAIFREFERLAADGGYRCLVGQAHEDEENIRQLIDDFQAYNPIAVVAFAHAYPHCDFNLYKHLRKYDNIVLYGAEDAPVPSFPAVEADWVDCYYSLARQALLSGRRRIAIMTSTPFYTDRHVEGYKKALKELGLPFCPELLVPKTVKNSAGEDSHVLAAELASVRADAFFAEDFILAPLSNELQANGMRIPEDISLFGRDDECFCTYMRPAISTINHNNCGAALMLYEMVEGIAAGNAPEAGLRFVKAQLIERQSSAFFANARIKH